MISEKDFLAAPRAEVMRIAPPVIVYAPAGTRRQAALAGVDAAGDAYAAWSHARMLDACQLLFDYGIRHIFTLLAAPNQFREVGAYRSRLLDWIAWGAGGDEALHAFRRRGWRVRLFDGGELPELDRARTRLAELPGDGTATLWFQVVQDAESPWRWLLDALQRSQARTREEAIRALYGEDLPLATLFLGFGKPVVAPELIPPLLAGAVQCYWSQRPGYSLDETDLRRLLYDYAYTRSTWRADKTGRAEAAALAAPAWERGPLLGLGTRLGPFWYPAPFSIPTTSGEPGL